MQPAPVHGVVCGLHDTRRGGNASAHVDGPFYAEPAADYVDRFFVWFNNERPNMALDMSILLCVITGA